MASSGTFLGTFTGGTSYKPYIKWNIQSQNINNNTSTIYIEFGHYKAASNSTSYNNSGSATLSLTSNGTSLKNSSVTFDFRNASVGSYNKIWSGTQTITHNADGTKSFTISATNNTDISLGTGTVTANVTLDTIPRATTISSLSNLTLSNNTSTSSVTIGLTVNSTSFKHTIEYKVGSTVIKTETNKTFGSTGSQNYAFSLDATQVNNIFSAMSTKTSETATITVKTYASDGTTLLGTNTKTATVTLDSTVVPSISGVTVAETVSDVTTKVGTWVQTKSIPKYTITASASRGSSISEYKVVVDGLTLTSASNNITLSRALNSSGMVTATVTVTDGRGRTVSTTQSITVLAYNTPSVSSFNIERCKSDGTVDEVTGTNAKVTFTANVSNLTNGTQKNNITYKLYYKTKSDTWGSVNTNFNTTENGVITKTVTGSLIKQTDNTTLITVNLATAYDFKLEVSDVFGTTTTVYDDISTAQVTLSLHKNGVGVGKIWQQGALDVQGNVYIGGSSTMYFNLPTGNRGTISAYYQPNREELKITASGDDYDTDSNGAGIRLYGNNDAEHKGHIAFLTGENGTGTAKMIVTKKGVTVGNAIWDYTDEEDSGTTRGLLNIKNSTTNQPSLYLEGASSNNGDIAFHSNEYLQVGKYDTSTATFTTLVTLENSGKLNLTNCPSIVYNDDFLKGFCVNANHLYYLSWNGAYLQTNSTSVTTAQAFNVFKLARYLYMYIDVWSSSTSNTVTPYVNVNNTDYALPTTTTSNQLIVRIDFNNVSYGVRSGWIYLKLKNSNSSYNGGIRINHMFWNNSGSITPWTTITGV